MRTWLNDVRMCVDKIDKDIFSLEDIYQFEDYLSSLHPRNHHIKDKIRQQLQLLRDNGELDFLNNSGLYKKML